MEDLMDYFICVKWKIYHKDAIVINICIDDEDRMYYIIVFTHVKQISEKIPLCFGSLISGSLKICSLLFCFMWGFFYRK